MKARAEVEQWRRQFSVSAWMAENEVPIRSESVGADWEEDEPPMTPTERVVCALFAILVAALLFGAGATAIWGRP